MGNWTITEAVDRAIQEAIKQGQAHGFSLPSSSPPTDLLAENLYGLVSLVLYLCSDEPEIDDEREPGTAPQRPRPTRTKMAGASSLQNVLGYGVWEQRWARYYVNR